MEVLNELASPPILVKSTVTRSLNHWSKNQYIDPEDGEAFFVADLNSTELGHVYHWKPTSYQWVLVHMPYKVMDQNTGSLLRGLRSYKTVSPYVNGSLPERHLKNPKSCIKDFRLSSSDFDTFSRRVNQISGLLHKDEVDVEELLVSVRTLSGKLEEFTSDINTFRRKTSLVSSDKFYTSREDLQQVLSRYSEYRKLFNDLLEEAVQIVVRIDKLSKESGRETEKVRVTEEYEVVKNRLSEFRRIPIDRYEREAIHKSRVDMGEDSNENTPMFIRDLAQEINELKAYYPCLRRLRVVSNEEVAVDLTGVDVSITADRVIVRGDPGALSAYTGENTTVDDSVSSKRVRSIIGASNREK